MPIVIGLLLALVALILIALIDFACWVLCRFGLAFVECVDCHRIVAKSAAAVVRTLGGMAFVCPGCCGSGPHGINL